MIDTMLTPATLEKRDALRGFIERVVRPIDCIRGLAAIGSVATGAARSDSDLDLVAFLEPFDQYALPAEAIWRPSDGSYHSIFKDVDGLQIDIFRIDLAAWRAPAFDWPEGRRAELADCWLAFDRSGEVAGLIAERIAYDELLRRSRLDEAVTWLDQHLDGDTPAMRWETLGPAIAYDRLNAAYSYLVAALFALNRRWRPWRNREMDALLRLAWLPERFSERVLAAACPPALDRAGYDARVLTLRGLMADLLAQACAEGIYDEDPVGEAFVRSNEEPGRAWNIAAWEAEHRRRYRAG